MSAPKLTAEETKEIVELFKGGTTCKEIAELYNRKYGTVWALLKREGLLKKDEPKEDKVSEKEVPSFDARRTAPLADKKASTQASDRPIMRGDIYYVNFPSYIETVEYKPARPAIIVSNKKNNMYSNFVEVVFLTTKPKKPMPTHVTVRSFDQFAIAMCEQIHSVSKKQLQTYGRTCSAHEMSLIDKALAVSLELDFESVTAPAKVISETSVVDEEINTDYQEVVFERDTYKRLYEELLDKLVKR